MVWKGTKMFSLSGPLLEESWILLRRTPMTVKGWPSICDDFADGRVAVEEFVGGVGAEDDDLAVVGEVGGFEVAAVLRRRACAFRRRGGRWPWTGC